MANYAVLDKNNVVIQVITGKDENEGPYDWEVFYSAELRLTVKRTSYNTKNGAHLNGGIPFRKNFAGIGYKYDVQLDAFIPPQPFESWTFDEQTCQWVCPVAYPNDGQSHVWNEDQQTWV